MKALGEEKLDRINELLDRLAKENFTVENIINSSDLKLLLNSLDLMRAERVIHQRYLKYIAKRGDVVYPPSREALYEAIRGRVYLDVFLKAALDFLGVRGPHRLDYLRIAYKLMKRLKGMRLECWPEILEEAAAWWERPVKLDPKIAKIITILTAKVLYQLHYGKLRLEKIPHEILYPEVKHGGEERAVQGSSGES